MQLTVFFLFIVVLFSTQCNAQKVQFTENEKAWISAHPVIEFGNDPLWRPYEMIEDGVYSGIIKEFITQIEDATGIDMVPIKGLTWPETIDELKAGTIHIVPSIVATENRSSYLDFSNVYLKDPHIIATRKDYEFVGSLSDLKGKKITIPKNFFSIEIISRDYPLIEIVVGDNIEDCLEKLSYGEVDAFVGALGVVSYYINNAGFTNLKIAAPTEYKDMEMSFAVTKDWIGFIPIINKVLKTISSERKIQLKKEWISVRYDHGISWKEALYWVVSIGGGILLVFLLFYIRNRSLKKQVDLRVQSQERLTLSVQQNTEHNEEKKVLLRDIHQRVKNNLEIITNLIQLQVSNSEDEEVVASLSESIDRIRAIALIHDKIYNSSELNLISTESYIKSLVFEIVDNFSDQKEVRLEVKSTTSAINLKSIVPLALILNELIINSLKYGLVNKSKGEIVVDIDESNNAISMRYFDNGKWIEKDIENEGFGTSLIDIFTEQLEGSYQLNKLEIGTEYLFTFKLNSF